MPNVDLGAIATYLSLLFGVLCALAGAIYKMGKLSKTFETHMTKIAQWESALSNLNSIPDIKIGLEATRTQLDRHRSQITDLCQDVAFLKGRLSLAGLAQAIKEDR